MTKKVVVHKVRDIVGKLVKVGDIVAFALAGKGATGFASGTVSKVNKSGVQIEQMRRIVSCNWDKREYETLDKEYSHTVNRAEFSFAIVEM